GRCESTPHHLGGEIISRVRARPLLVSFGLWHNRILYERQLRHLITGFARPPHSRESMKVRSVCHGPRSKLPNVDCPNLGHRSAAFLKTFAVQRHAKTVGAAHRLYPGETIEQTVKLICRAITWLLHQQVGPFFRQGVRIANRSCRESRWFERMGERHCIVSVCE